MTKMLLSASVSALVMAGGASLAMAQTTSSDTAGTGMQNAAADMISCSEISGLDDQQAEQVLFYVAGFMEGQGAGGTDLGSASTLPGADGQSTAGSAMPDTDPGADLADGAAGSADLGSDGAASDDLAASPDSGALDDSGDMAASDSTAADDLAADSGTVDSEPSDDLAASDPAGADDATIDDGASDLSATDPATPDGLAEAPASDGLSGENMSDDMAASDPAIDSETTAALGSGAGDIVGFELDVQQVLSTCQDDPSMTLSAAIDQHQSAQ